MTGKRISRLAFASAIWPMLAFSSAATASDVSVITPPAAAEKLGDQFRNSAQAQGLQGVGETRCYSITSAPIPGRQPPTFSSCTINHACFRVEMTLTAEAVMRHSLTGERSRTCTASLLASARSAFANTFVACGSEKGRKAAVKRLMNEARADIRALCKTMSGSYEVIQRSPDAISESVFLQPVARAKRKER